MTLQSRPRALRCVSYYKMKNILICKTICRNRKLNLSKSDTSDILHRWNNQAKLVDDELFKLSAFDIKPMKLLRVCQFVRLI